MIEPSVYLPALTNDFLIAGARSSSRNFIPRPNSRHFPNRRS
jgi:hypothetical protein